MLPCVQVPTTFDDLRFPTADDGLTPDEAVAVADIALQMAADAHSGSAERGVLGPTLAFACNAAFGEVYWNKAMAAFFWAGATAYLAGGCTFRFRCCRGTARFTVVAGDAGVKGGNSFGERLIGLLQLAHKGLGSETADAAFMRVAVKLNKSRVPPVAPSTERGIEPVFWCCPQAAPSRAG